MADPIVKSVMKKGDKAAMIHFDVGQAAWSPDFQAAVTLIGKPLPKDWRLEQGEYGPKALPPKQGKGGATAWRNTKEGFEAEAAGRQRWQQVEEERRDRRTALMQAVALGAEKSQLSVEGWRKIADQMYEWLRSSPAGGPHSGVPTKGGNSSGDSPETRGVGNRVSPAGGTTSADAADLGKDGVEAGGAGPGEPSLSPGSAPTYEGNFVPDHNPGGIQTATIYPGDPDTCTHKGASGRWLPTKQVDGIPRCPRCGANAVIYRESA